MSGICLFCAHAQARPQPRSRCFGKSQPEINKILLESNPSSPMIFCHENPKQHWEMNAISFSCECFAKAEFFQIDKRIAFYKQSPSFNPVYEQLAVNI